jgi:hypothetical protein
MSYRQDKQYDYYTVRKDEYDEWSVHGFGTYPQSSVLDGQPMKVWLDSFPTREEALAKYPDATGGSKWTDPQVSLSHLPDDADY